MAGDARVRCVETDDARLIYNPDRQDTEWVVYWPSGKPSGNPL